MAPPAERWRRGREMKVNIRQIAGRYNGQGEMIVGGSAGQGLPQS